MDPKLAEITQRRCPEVPVHIDSVANVAALCANANVESVDVIPCLDFRLWYARGGLEDILKTDVQIIGGWCEPRATG